MKVTESLLKEFVALQVDKTCGNPDFIAQFEQLAVLSNEIDAVLVELKKELSKEQFEKVDTLESIMVSYQTQIEEIMYQQGFKDGTKFMNEVIGGCPQRDL